MDLLSGLMSKRITEVGGIIKSKKKTKGMTLQFLMTTIPSARPVTAQRNGGTHNTILRRKTRMMNGYPFLTAVR